MPDTLQTPILIVGAGCGGFAAALAVARAGGSCVLTEPTDWVGGQLTSQAVPPDENAWIEPDVGDAQAATASYLAFREAVRSRYRRAECLTAAAAARPRLNPGDGWVSRLCFSPRIGQEVLRETIRPHVEAGRIRLLLEHEPVSADGAANRVRSVTVRGGDGRETRIAADYVLDATEAGDLYPLTGCEHAVGAECRDAYGELHAPAGRGDGPGGSHPRDQQAVSWCFAMEHRPGRNHVGPEPEGYARWRSFVPDLDPPWCGPLFSWLSPGVDERPREMGMVPWPDRPADGVWELWRYRRIVDASAHTDGRPDVCLVNWVQMDQFVEPVLGVSPDAARAALKLAKQQARCLFHWMQTEAPRHDGGRGYPGLKLRGDELGTDSGFAKAAYIREPRRLLARTIIHEGHLGAAQRRAAGEPEVPELATTLGESVPAAEPFADAVGVGHYRLDLHPSCAGRNSVYVEAAPYRIPLGSLIPVRVENLLAAGKGFGVSHVVNGCTRLHPVEWTVGEAAGELAAWCLEHGRTPAEVHADAAQTRRFQDRLRARGFALAWPWEKS
ncbi:FAD-dependent oxidoreductase [Phycisphaera mikurensis]|uniref:FAD dependent oxidoreductase n=1 Tax=Phycisphaera mikurensis (strain NBRC 102666 / KCTC 22515 / FYK2301M01) TaxID=1142394 RepID=I0IDW8_PHYMF|nr:FAD-dependent oxidoreductase [Phycisphaera mikurensis]MBB6441263.1 hypothetical protein [Phycisphaera mikurensis]BAM03456.1 hypothetical protein PSMK_12970 [Phycisphaera mikurensis NBRC 102666]